jgi:hypothetical protein
MVRLTILGCVKLPNYFIYFIKNKTQITLTHFSITQNRQRIKENSGWYCGGAISHYGSLTLVLAHVYS